MSIFYILRNKIFFVAALILSPVLFWLAKRRVRNYGDAPRILVIPQLTRVGDLVCATPVFRAIKKKHPKSFLAVLVTRKVSGIIKNNPYIDEIIHFQTKGYSDILQNVRMLRFDWGVCLNPSWVGTITMIYGLIPKKIKILRESRSFGEWFSDWMSQFRFLYKDHTYLPGHYLKLLEPLGIFGVEDIKEVFVSEEGERKAEEFLATSDKRQATNRALVGISITAGNKIKEWGDDKFVELAKRIVAKYNARVIFIGSRTDEERVMSVSLLVASGQSGVAVPVTDFSLEELPSLIKRLDLYIAVDTGPIYIAEALGVPLIDIIGPVDPKEQPPCDKLKCLCVLPKGDIRPSSFVFKKVGRAEEHIKALQATTIDMVMEAVDRML